MNSSVDVEPAIWTVTEVAQFLRVPRSTVYKLAKRGLLPGQKVGKHWRFVRDDIEKWIRSRPDGRSVD
ncbi:helix-turn-helix domain-containing protein [Candidatus Nitrospira bockiana]